MPEFLHVCLLWLQTRSNMENGKQESEQKVLSTVRQALDAILSIGGYVGTAASQSASAITAIRTSYIYVPIILTVIQIIVLFFYHLDEEYDSILNDLKSRRISK